jgi:hypothetical protein
MYNNILSKKNNTFFIVFYPNLLFLYNYKKKKYKLKGKKKNFKL